MLQPIELHNTFKVKELIEFAKKGKPKRWYKTNSDKKFNDVRVTDFTYINHKGLWEFLSILRRTGIKVITVVVDYVEGVVRFLGDTFSYNFYVEGKTEHYDIRGR